MTKREPFAVARLMADGSGYEVRLRGNDTAFGCVEAYHLKELAEHAARKINAANSEAVREAVEEFKNRVVGVVIKNVTQSIDDRRVPAKVGHDIYEKILALPTEREGQ